MQKQSSDVNKSILEHPFLGRGFRPFFALGAFYSMLMLFIWGGYYAGYITPPSFIVDSLSWHAHEMVYGYTLSIIAGFLLTAVANWTAHAPARQLHLLSLCLVWVSGRIVMNVDLGLPHWLIYIIAVSFIPALAISLSIPLLKSWNKRNFVFLMLLSILSISQICFLVFGIYSGVYIALMMVMVMISLIGGRVIPAFTVAALRRTGVEVFQTPQMKMDIAAVLSIILTAICLVMLPDSIFLFVAAMGSAVIHALRISHYHSLKTLSDPMVWILHVGFIWLIAGLFLMGLSGLGIVPISIAIHALTAGAVGSMTLGMMCRVSLGHTGRNLITTKLTLLGFILIQLAALIRVFGILLLPNLTTELIIASAALWSLSFALYLIIYIPMLVSARPDGRSS